MCLPRLVRSHDAFTLHFLSVSRRTHLREPCVYTFFLFPETRPPHDQDTFIHSSLPCLHKVIRPRVRQPTHSSCAPRIIHPHEALMSFSVSVSPQSHRVRSFVICVFVSARSFLPHNSMSSAQRFEPCFHPFQCFHPFGGRKAGVTSPTNAKSRNVTHISEEKVIDVLFMFMHDRLCLLL